LLKIINNSYRETFDGNINLLTEPKILQYALGGIGNIMKHLKFNQNGIETI